MDLPPIQIGALPQVTTDRIAQARSNPPSSSSSSSPSAQTKAQSLSSRSSRATSRTTSTLQKQSDVSLRSSRQQLPTITGSPSVGTHGKEVSQGSTISSHTARELRDQPPQNLGSMSSSMSSSLPKETSTRIPCIASRSSAATSPVYGASGTHTASRRTSMIVSSTANSTEVHSAVDDSVNEFGVLSDGTASKHSTFRQSLRASPIVGGSRNLRQGLSTVSASGLDVPSKRLAHDSVLSRRACASPRLDRYRRWHQRL